MINMQNQGYNSGAAVTPSDTNANSFRALYIGGAGTLRVIDEAGQTVNFAAVTAGSLIPLGVRQVHSSGTSATGIVGLQ